MPLSTGDRLGPHEVLARLGAGSMGEVHSAADTRLHRAGVIKVLPKERVADSERKRRFLQEARAASALNHPNIVTLHDIANDGDVNYLVMEYVPGKSLDKLITPKEGLPRVEVIGYVTCKTSGPIFGVLASASSEGTSCLLLLLAP
jgi:serine/threonine protein kinase